MNRLIETAAGYVRIRSVAEMSEACPVCNHALRESLNISVDTRWECAHCSWGWTEYNHDARDQAGHRYVTTENQQEKSQ